MMHPDTEIRFISDEIGYGVVATRLIPKGTITWVQDELDHIIQPEEVKRMQKLTQDMLEKYSFRNSKGEHVLCWDLAKYVNHSFNANCLSTAYDFELAIRDIHPGEQLTDDYGYLNVSEPFKAQDEGTERNTVYPDDLLHFHEQWDAQLKGAFHFFEQVEQPLAQLVSSEHLNLLKERLRNNRPLDSILNLYYQGK